MARPRIYKNAEERRQAELDRKRQEYREFKGGEVRPYRRQGDKYKGTFWMRKLSSYRTRASKKGLPFNLTCSYLESIWTDKCPVTNRKFVIGCPKDAPSLDRLVPEKGYVEGNVAWISRRANTIKNDASLEDLKMVVEWLEAQSPTESRREPVGW